jgi:RNA polymerase sigma-70 factor (ECF subfamily)
MSHDPASEQPADIFLQADLFASAPANLEALLLEELRVLYQAHAPMLVRLAMIECRNLALAEDAVQEAFLRYYAERRRGLLIRTPRAWLARVILNLLVDEARRQKPRVRLVESIAAGEQETGPAAMLEQLRSRVSPREFECLQLRCLGFKYHEIAETLGISGGSVARLMSRALNKARSYLRDERRRK